MTASTQLLCPVLVDRTAEMAVLQQALERAVAGIPQAVAICGEAGIGKSRLTRGFLEVATAQYSPLVITFHPSPHEEAGPCAAIVDGFRRLVRRLDSFPGVMIDAAPSLHPLIAAIMPELPLEGGMDGRAVEDSWQVTPATALHRRRLFEDLLAVLDALSEAVPAEESDSTPMVLLLEDVQWADETTLQFLQYVLHVIAADRAEGHTKRRLLFLMTARTGDDVEPGAAIRLLTRMISQRLAHQIVLGPLSSEAHAQFVTATIGHPLSPELETLLFEHSEGNPFVIEELLGSLASNGSLRWERARWIEAPRAALHLPLSLRVAVLDRLVDLSPGVQRVLTTAAVIGREFRFDELQAATGLDEGSLLSVVREAISRQILAEHLPVGSTFDSGVDHYHFRHALTRQFILSDMLRCERRLLHRRVAEMLEAQYVAAGSMHGGGTATPSDRITMLFRMAYHSLQACMPDRVRSYALAAGRLSSHSGSVGEARRYLEMALKVTPLGEPERGAILEQLGITCLAMMDVSRGQQVMSEALADLRAGGSLTQAVRIQVGMIGALWLVDPEQTRELARSILSEAVARFGEDSPADQSAILLYGGAALAAALHRESDGMEGQALLWAERAVSTGKMLGPDVDPLLWRAYAGRGLALVDGSRVEEGIVDLERALSLGLTHAMHEAVTLTYAALISTLERLGQDARALALYDEARRYEHRTGVIVPSSSALYAYLAQGRIEGGLREGQSRLTAFGSLNIPSLEGAVMVALGHVQLAAGRVEESRTSFEKAWTCLQGTSGAALLQCLWGRAKIAALQGCKEEADHLYGQVEARWRHTTDRTPFPPILLDGSLYFAETGNGDAAEAWAAVLGEIADRTQNPVARASYRQALGGIALQRREHVEAAAYLQEAAERWHALRRPLREAEALTLLARSLLARGGTARQRAQADHVLKRALDTCDGVGARGIAESVLELRRTVGLPVDGEERPGRRTDPSRFRALTRRERDVFELLAEGRTNRDIARTLFIAESTAELHVSRVLGKLDCATRAQAAALAARDGVVTAAGPLSR